MARHNGRPCHSTIWSSAMSGRARDGRSAVRRRAVRGAIRRLQSHPMDHHAAGQGPFGQPVAHGLLGFAIASGLMSQAPRLDTLAFLAILEWRFHHPILFGDTIHGLSRVDALEPSGNGRRGVVTWYRRNLNQDDQSSRRAALRPSCEPDPAEDPEGHLRRRSDSAARVTRHSLRQRCCTMILPPIIRAFDPNHLVLAKLSAPRRSSAERRGSAG